MDKGWAELAAAVCEVAVDDYRQIFRLYLRCELLEEKAGLLKQLRQIRREMKNQLFWDMTMESMNFDEAADIVEKQEAEKWQEEEISSE